MDSTDSFAPGAAGPSFKWSGEEKGGRVGEMTGCCYFWGMEGFTEKTR